MWSLCRALLHGTLVAKAVEGGILQFLLLVATLTRAAGNAGRRLPYHIFFLVLHWLLHIRVPSRDDLRHVAIRYNREEASNFA